MLTRKEFYGIPGGTNLTAICAAALKRKPCKKTETEAPNFRGQPMGDVLCSNFS